MILLGSVAATRAILAPMPAPTTLLSKGVVPEAIELEIAVTEEPDVAEFLAKSARSDVAPRAHPTSGPIAAHEKSIGKTRASAVEGTAGDVPQPAVGDATEELAVGWSLHAFEGASALPEPPPAPPTATAQPTQTKTNESTELSAATQRMFAVALDDADYAKGTMRGGPILAAARRAMAGENAPDVGKAIITVRYLRDGTHRVDVLSTGEVSRAWPNFRRDLETALRSTNVRVASSAAGLEVRFEIEALHQLYDGRDERIVGTVSGGTLNPEAKSDRNPDLPRVTVVGAVYNGRVCSGVAGVAVQRSPNGLPAVPFGLGVGLDCGVNVPSRRMVRVKPLGESRL
jgi:hypothetical protein